MQAEAEDDATLAPVLAAFRAAYRLSQAGLASWLGVREADLAILARYPRPDPASPRFHAECMAIAQETGADVAVLRKALQLS